MNYWWKSWLFFVCINWDIITLTIRPLATKIWLLLLYTKSFHCLQCSFHLHCFYFILNLIRFCMNIFQECYQELQEWFVCSRWIHKLRSCYPPKQKSWNSPFRANIIMAGCSSEKYLRIWDKGKILWILRGVFLSTTLCWS